MGMRRAKDMAVECPGFLDILDVPAVSREKTRILEAAYRSCVLASIRHLVSPEPSVCNEHTPLTGLDDGWRLARPLTSSLLEEAND